MYEISRILMRIRRGDVEKGEGEYYGAHKG